MTISIKVKSKTGHVDEITVAEVIEIDGRPYEPKGNSEVLIQAYNQLSGRVQALENILSSLISTEG